MFILRNELKMPEKKFNKVYSKCLRHYLKVNGITHLELAKNLLLELLLYINGVLNKNTSNR